MFKNTAIPKTGKQKTRLNKEKNTFKHLSYKGLAGIHRNDGHNKQVKVEKHIAYYPDMFRCILLQGKKSQNPLMQNTNVSAEG